MTINIYDAKTFQIKSILNPNIERLVRCIAINKGTNKELAAYYEGGILLFDIQKETIIEKFKCAEPKQLEFNKDNQISIVLSNGDLQILDLFKKKIENIKVSGRVNLSRWYPFESSEIAYANNERKVILLNLVSKGKTKTIDLNANNNNYKDDVQITELSWYDLDESYKYILIGLSDGTMQLNEFVEGLCLMRFEKFGGGKN